MAQKVELSDEDFAKILPDIKKIFHIYDIDPNGDDPNSGKLSSTEVPRAMRAVGLCLSEVVASDIECDIDCDYESLCDEKLFIDLCRKHYCIAPTKDDIMRAFSAMNNGKIKIATDEFVHMLKVMGPRRDRLTEEEEQHFRKVIDKKRSGNVNLKGFAKYLTTSLIPDTNITASPIKQRPSQATVQDA